MKAVFSSQMGKLVPRRLSDLYKIIQAKSVGTEFGTQVLCFQLLHY